MTEPALPVVHGTTVNLNCNPGFINKGAEIAKCLYGQVLSTSGVPYCRGEFDKLCKK